MSGTIESKRIVGSLALPVLALVLASGCNKDVGAQPAPKPEAPAAKPVAKPVAKLAFIDQAECCECTRSRIDASWAALQKALAKHPGLPVERIHADTQEQKAERYQVERAILVMPALYFVDADGRIVDQLQGELTAAKIEAVLVRSSGAGSKG